MHLIGDAGALLFLRIDQLLQIDAALRLIPPEPTDASAVHAEQRQCDHRDASAA